MSTVVGAFGRHMYRFSIPLDFLSRVKFWNQADRIGPDIPSTHWQLHFNSTMNKLCKKRFKKFGDESDFRPGSYAEACSKISIGDRVVIRPGSFLFADPTEGGGEIVIEGDVLLGSGIHIYTNNHEFSNTQIPISEQGYPLATISNSVTIKRGSWIGANSIILPGITIGANSVVGAGSVVTKSLPAGVLAVGNPARVIRNLND
jgi:acetyltransferase-like isoleucine patch superfamily enzyme